MFPSKNFLECLQVETSSFRVLRVANDGWYIIKNFSHRHRLHRWVVLVNGLACFKTRHLMLKVILASFSFHINLLSSVSLRLFGCRKLAVCPLNRVLNSPSVRPTYVSIPAHYWWGVSTWQHSTQAIQSEQHKNKLQLYEQYDVNNS